MNRFGICNQRILRLKNSFNKYFGESDFSFKMCEEESSILKMCGMKSMRYLKPTQSRHIPVSKHVSYRKNSKFTRRKKIDCDRKGEEAHDLKLLGKSTTHFLT